MQARKYSWQLYALAGASGIMLAAMFLYALTVYWSEFRMGSGFGPTAFVSLVGLPLSLVLAGGLTWFSLRRSRRRGHPPAAGLARSTVLVAAVFGVLFALEFFRTTGARGPESGGSLAGFVQRLARQ